MTTPLSGLGPGSAIPPTAWDGYVRVDYVPEAGRRAGRGRLQVTFATVEATIETDVRPELRAGFVVDDPDGPPAFVRVSVSRGRLAGDVRELLGRSLVAVAEQVIAGPGRSRWTRLNLLEVDSLAGAWAPYRDLVLAASLDEDSADDDPDRPAPRPRAGTPRTGTPSARIPHAGTLEEGLWALLAADELTRSIAELADPRAAGTLGHAGPIHGDGVNQPDAAPAGASGAWTIPPELAARAGIEPELGWELGGGQVHVVARAAAGTAGPPTGSGPVPRVEVAFDDNADRWETLEPAPDGTLRAVIISLADPDRLRCVRIRVTLAGPATS